MPRGRLWAPLRSSDHRRLWAALLISVVADTVDQIALGVLVYEITGSELQMGIMLASSMLPAALFGMVAGAYVDRRDRRRTMIVADLTRAALVCTVPFVAEYSLIAVYGSPSSSRRSHCSSSPRSSRRSRSSSRPMT